MVHPFFLQLLQPQLDVQLLLDPCYQLSGDGQLRELMQERRRHLVDGSGGLWYLSPELPGVNYVGGSRQLRWRVGPPDPLPWQGVGPRWFWGRLAAH